jgi:hypothetical protein
MFAFRHSTTTLTEFRGIGWSSDILHSCIHCRLATSAFMRKTALYIHVLLLHLHCRREGVAWLCDTIEDEGGN